MSILEKTQLPISAHNDDLTVQFLDDYYGSRGIAVPIDGDFYGRSQARLAREASMRAHPSYKA